MLPEPIQAVVQMADVLEALGIRYFVGGSVASSRYGRPRSTQDVDIVIELQPRHVASLVQQLQDEFYIDAGQVRDAIQHHSSFNVVYQQTADKVDVFIMPDTPWAREEMARRRPVRHGPVGQEVTLYFCTPEDLILHKLQWYRLGGGVSDRQWTDIQGVLSVQRSTLDLSYLRSWAGELGLADLLEQALKQVGMNQG